MRKRKIQPAPGKPRIKRRVIAQAVKTVLSDKANSKAESIKSGTPIDGGKI